MVSRGNTKRRLVALAAGFGLVATALPATVASASNDAEAKISSVVTKELARDGSADVWFYFGDKADLSAANSMSWADRGQFVYEALNATADASQADVRALLDEAGVDYESFYLVNAIKVSAADADLVRSAAAFSSVSSVDADVPTLADRPVKVESVTNAQVENWGVPNINAPQAWELGATGEGIVVGIIDSGVDGEHEALADSWRGAGGVADYNWMDFADTPSPTPVDDPEIAHGTHVTGTVLGSSNEVVGNMGVAQDAQWIAAAPGMIDDRAISDEGLLSAMQWMLAPTDLNGENANPAMRPHVINNSWGQPLSVEAFGEDSQAAWTAAGIFSTFSIGNDGPDCETRGAPGSRTINYSVGSYDVDNVISDFSSRGPGQDGVTKPDISAPGDEIPSSVPGNQYAIMSGTSMAAPHVSGAVAALWSAAPALVGDVAGTRAILGNTAIDTADDQCGGSDDFNNVYGEGRLDLLAALEAAQADPEPEPPAVEVTRYAGEHRYETAAVIAEQYANADTVYITTGTAFADSLAGGPAASRGVLGFMETPEGEPAPVLLTKPTYLPDHTKTILETISPSNIVILGREAAVSTKIEQDLAAYGDNVSRIGGADRYETAVNIAREFDDPDTIYVALGLADYYADALAGSALAGRDGVPVVLTKTDSVPASTKTYLEEHPDANIIVLGGEVVVSEAVYDEIGASDRYGAADRYLSSLEISKQFDAAEHVFVATGKDYADALAGGAYAGSVNGPVILVNGERDELPNGEVSENFKDKLEAELDRLAPSSVVILGGTRAVSQGIEDQITEMVNN